MQLRRLALVVAALAAIAAIGWFARRGPERPTGALDAPRASAPARTETAASALEAQSAAPARSAADPKREALTEALPGGSGSAPPGDPGGDSAGLVVRVLDPSGKPSPGARISFVTSGDGPLSVGLPRPTDAAGCWRCRISPGHTLNLRATDPTNRYAPAYAFDIGAERRTLDMRLESATSHTLVVTDEDGAPIERFAWRMLDERQYVSHPTGKIPLDENGRLQDTSIGRMETGSFTPAVKDRLEHPAGRVELRIGSLAVAVQVEAEDFEQAQAGPFAAIDAPNEIHVVLQRLPGIRGRVVHEGKGVPGAWVKLLQPPHDGRTLYVNGFPSSSQPWAVAESKADDEGRFVLQLRQTGEYLIRAGAEGHCLAELGPRRFEAHQGAEGLELALPAAGSIEGRVLFAGDESQRDWIIGASRGDGLARSVHTDAEGRFHFGSLSPGEWLLRPADADLNPDEVHAISDGGELDRSAPATCVVRAGESTQVEFDLRVKAVLGGACELPGWEKAECRGSLEAIGGTLSRTARFESVNPGSLRAVVDQPGTYRLRVTLLGADRTCNLGILEDMRLEAGENPWRIEQALGELVLVNALEAERWATLRCELGGTRSVSLSVKLAAHEERRFSGLPVGKWLLLKTDDGAVREDTSVEVVPTGAARLELR
jgi:hypothetical protein